MTETSKASGDPLFNNVLFWKKKSNWGFVRTVFLFSSVCGPEKRKHPLPWQRWHLPATDRLHLTARQRATAPPAPPAHIGQRARWVDRVILWIPFLSLSPQMVPACLETRSLGDPAVWPLLADTADPRMDTLVRDLHHEPFSSYLSSWQTVFIYHQ